MTNNGSTPFNVTVMGTLSSGEFALPNLKKERRLFVCP
jgi:hypothetical protein